MSIEIKKRDDKIILVYKPENGDASFIQNIFDEKGTFQLKRVFEFLPKNVLKPNDHEYVFLLGKLNNLYYEINSDILGMTHDLLIHKDVQIGNQVFYKICRTRYISIFFELERYLDRDIVIGGDGDNSIPENVFKEIINCFPNEYEIDKYVDSKVAYILTTVFDDGIDDFPGKYEKYTKKKIDNLKKQLSKTESIFGGEALNQYEIVKYEAIKTVIEKWLEDPIEMHSEADWQHLIKQVILLLFPKYIAVFEEAPVEDPYKKTKNGRNTTRELDYLLVDADGNCDLAEIKAPFEHCILSTTLYRDNYVPLRELSGAIMQVEKYIFYMNKKGIDADKKLNEKYKNQLPANFEIKVTNPKGLIILGRSNKFDEKQTRDFEIIKRKYQHVMDILSYDDILARLTNIITMLKK